MKTIKVLGSGCTKCRNTIKLINEVAQQCGIEISIDKVEDPAQIMLYGVMSTPAVVMDEKVVHKGGIPSKEQIELWLKG